MKNVSIIIKILLLLFVWGLWFGAVNYMMDQFINRDFPGFLQLIIALLAIGGTAFLLNSSILFINKKILKK